MFPENSNERPRCPATPAENVNDIEISNQEGMKKQISRLSEHNTSLIKEIETEKRVIQLLFIAGHLSPEKLEQATQLVQKD